MTYQYDGEFFDFVSASAGRSAALFIGKFVDAALGGAVPASVLDIGCGRGVWAAEWSRRSVARTLGVDGDYVSSSALAIPASSFVAQDISRTFQLNERFELVQCLEVAEHVPRESAETLVDNITRHGDLILFSAAIPGQGGEFHVNEQPYSYWRSKFAARGYRLYDAVRRHVVSLGEIEPWYRYNAFVFANERGAQRLSSAARATLLRDDETIRDLAPLLWRLRCSTLSLLPAAAIDGLARLKHKVANLTRPKAVGS